MTRTFQWIASPPTSRDRSMDIGARLAMVAMVLGCVIVTAGRAVAEEAEAKPPALTAADFPLRLSSISWSIHGSHIPPTAPVRRSHYSTMWVSIRTPHDVRPLAVSNTQLDVLETDTGIVTSRESDGIRESLDIAAKGPWFSYQSMSHRTAPRNDFTARIALPRISLAAKRFTRVEGTFTVLVGIGEPERVKLGRLDEIMNRRIDVDLDRGGRFVWRRDEQARLVFECSPSLACTLYDVIGENEKGEVVPLSPRQTGSAIGPSRRALLVTLTAKPEIPGSTIITLLRYPNPTELKLPFAFRDLPTPWAEADTADPAGAKEETIVLPIPKATLPKE